MPQETARRYRLFAEELRTIAEMDRDPGTSGRLLGVARDYDRMASSMDAVNESREKVSRGRY